MNNTTCCKEQWHDQCCCNCQHHIEDFYHCATGFREANEGCICSKHKGWICMPPEFEGKAYSGWDEHGMCEMWTKIKEVANAS